jgi:hypothetical protein
LFCLPPTSRPAQASIASPTNTNCKISSTGRGRFGRWTLCATAGRTDLVLEDAGGEPLDRLLGAPMDVERFLRLATPIAAAIGKLRRRGPANIQLDEATARRG